MDSPLDHDYVGHDSLKFKSWISPRREAWRADKGEGCEYLTFFTFVASRYVLTNHTDESSVCECLLVRHMSFISAISPVVVHIWPICPVPPRCTWPRGYTTHPCWLSELFVVTRVDGNDLTIYNNLDVLWFSGHLTH